MKVEAIPISRTGERVLAGIKLKDQMATLIWRVPSLPRSAQEDILSRICNAIKVLAAQGTSCGNTSCCGGLLGALVKGTVRRDPRTGGTWTDYHAANSSGGQATAMQCAEWQTQQRTNP